MLLKFIFNKKYLMDFLLSGTVVKNHNFHVKIYGKTDLALFSNKATLKSLSSQKSWSAWPLSLMIWHSDAQYSGDFPVFCSRKPKIGCFHDIAIQKSVFRSLLFSAGTLHVLVHVYMAFLFAQYFFFFGKLNNTIEFL